MIPGKSFHPTLSPSFSSSEKGLLRYVIMSFHHDLDKWIYQSKKENCPYCLKEEDPMQSSTLKYFEHSELFAHPQVCLKGTCCLITKDHYVELFDLEVDVLMGFMKEVVTAAKVLKDVTKAVKINYEIHGNTSPHLHLHLFPRYMDDPFPGRPIDYNRIDPPVYQGDEFQLFVREMRQRLKNVDL
jgi:diadenosine tetraphosphate (Ap4A) HIT family hydrolase